MFFKPFGSTGSQPSASPGKIKEQWRKCEKENIKEENIIHNLQESGNKETVLQERNEMK
jgi:hypothetical protein